MVVLHDGENLSKAREVVLFVIVCDQEIVVEVGEKVWLIRKEDLNEPLQCVGGVAKPVWQESRLENSIFALKGAQWLGLLVEGDLIVSAYQI